MKKVIVAGMILAIYLNSAFAKNGNCDSKRTQQEYDTCYNQVIEMWNGVMKKMVALMQQSPHYTPAEKKQIIESQRQWANQVNSRCRNLVCIEASQNDRLGELSRNYHAHGAHNGW